MKTDIYKIRNMKCDGCSSRISAELKQIPGVISADADYISGTLVIKYALNSVTAKLISEKLDELGFPIV